MRGGKPYQKVGARLNRKIYPKKRLAKVETANSTAGSLASRKKYMAAGKLIEWLTYKV
jgi:hypothetical protein